MPSSAKSALAFLTVPGIILVVIAGVLLFDWNVSGGYGPISKFVALVGGIAFVGYLVVAIVKSSRN